MAAQDARAYVSSPHAVLSRPASTGLPSSRLSEAYRGYDVLSNNNNNNNFVSTGIRSSSYISQQQQQQVPLSPITSARLSSNINNYPVHSATYVPLATERRSVTYAQPVVNTSYASIAPSTPSFYQQQQQQQQQQQLYAPAPLQSNGYYRPPVSSSYTRYESSTSVNHIDTSEIDKKVVPVSAGAVAGAVLGGIVAGPIGLLAGGLFGGGFGVLAHETSEANRYSSRKYSSALPPPAPRTYTSSSSNALVPSSYTPRQSSFTSRTPYHGVYDYTQPQSSTYVSAGSPRVASYIPNTYSSTTPTSNLAARDSFGGSVPLLATPTGRNSLTHTSSVTYASPTAPSLPRPISAQEYNSAAHVMRSY